MTEEEYQRELEEAERLRRQINNVIDLINRTNRENVELEAELDTAIDNVGILINNCGSMDNEVYGRVVWRRKNSRCQYKRSISSFE